MSEKLFSFYIIGYISSHNEMRRVGTRYSKDIEAYGSKPFYTQEEILGMEDLTASVKKRVKTMRPGTKVKLHMEYRGADRYLQRVDGLENTKKELAEAEVVRELKMDLALLREELLKKEPDLCREIEKTEKALAKQKRILKKTSPNGIGIT